MGKKNLTLYAVTIVALSMIISPLIAAKPDTRLNGDVFIELQDDFVQFPGCVDPCPCSFVGTVSGDIEGVFYVHLVEAWFPAENKIEHFTEYWYIETDAGYIQGENKGKWTFSNFKWIANGEVTDASEEYEHLIGSRWQYSGTTNNPFVDDPVVGYGKFHITHNK
jgi:hypothetical protein